MSERIRFNTLIKGLRSEKSLSCLLILIISIQLSSCQNITEAPEQNASSRNYQGYAGVGEGYVYLDSPTALTGQDFVSQANFSKYLTTEFITSNNNLTDNCTFTQYTNSVASQSSSLPGDCSLVLNDSKSDTEPLTQKNGSWSYSEKSEADEFYQVNTYYHTNKILKRFREALSYTHKQVHFKSQVLNIPPATKFNFLATESHWLSQNGATTTLRVFSKCACDGCGSYRKQSTIQYFTPANISKARPSRSKTSVE